MSKQKKSKEVSFARTCAFCGEIGRHHPNCDRPAAQQANEYRSALKNLVEACGHVNLGALNGTTVKDFRKVMKFMAACDAAKELVGED